MTPRLDLFFDFLECDGGSVQLGDNKECKIRGIGKVRVQLKDGSSFVLHNVSEAGLQLLEKQELFGNKSLGKLDFSKNYVMGKSHRVSFNVRRRVWVYILRFKHKAFGKFKDWKQLVENQTGRTVKKLRTYNCLEFCNMEFEQLCTESRIARHLTVVGTAL
ncbi:retrovirus-related pol polyprotein from transposon TNT 1-94 [Tanacetum coccineum]